MVCRRLRSLVSGQMRSAHFVAVLMMGPLAAVAIEALRRIHLVARSPIWLVPVILVGGQVLTTSTSLWFDKSPSRVRLHARIASQALVVAATIYTIGWGPALAIGLVLVGQETLAMTGSSSQRAVLGWNLSCLAAGQFLIALGWAPTLVPAPEVHGLAVLMAIGITFSYRSLHTALVENEDAAALTQSHERRFRALVQSSTDLVFVVDSTAAVTYASPSCNDVLGYSPELLLGSGSGTLVHEDELDALRTAVGRAVEAAGGTAKFCFRVRHRDGTWRWLEGLATNLLEDAAVAGLVINARDVTERLERLERQEALGELGRGVLQETSIDAAFEASLATIARIVHTRGCRIVETEAEGSFEQPALPGPTQKSNHGNGTQVLERASRTMSVPIGDPERPLAHIVISSDRPLRGEDAQFVEGVAAILFSAIVRTRAEDAIRHQATHDPLTGLPNRTLFNDRLEHALARRARVGGYVAVMVVDLDGFKNVNDSLGHLVGDALLVAVADRFDEHLRDFDTIARLGGDEFAILVDDLDAPDQAGRIAQRVLDALTSPLELRDRCVATGASIGIALSDRRDTSPDRLLGDADAAMYRAKREGKGCYRMFEAAMHTAAVERMALEQALRTALAQNALTVHYQPVIDTSTGEIDSFEALARWEHPTRGFISPDTFIPLAEDSGLIIDLGHAILVEACHQARRWHIVYPHLRPRISVNVSRLQLVHPGFTSHVAEALARTELDPSLLTLEVTESVLAGESSRIIATLDELRRMGIRVAIDDFGTGYSSLAVLAELPIDILKIDKRFIDNIARTDEGRGFVQAIMHLARTLHLHTVAEGVERPEQESALTQLGCTHVQGYLHSPAVPADRVDEYLERDSVHSAKCT